MRELHCPVSVLRTSERFFGPNPNLTVWATSCRTSGPAVHPPIAENSRHKLGNRGFVGLDKPRFADEAQAQIAEQAVGKLVDPAVDGQ
jgi:hypothetical protein